MAVVNVDTNPLTLVLVNTLLKSPEAPGSVDAVAGCWQGGAGTDVYTVSRLNRAARSVLESELGNVQVAGEISNLSRPASGHMYFTLKDDKAQLRCAMFRNKNAQLAFAPEVGMGVIAGGRISLYEARGDYQLIVDTMKPAGAGDLYLAFEKLKQKLHKEGLFDADAKRDPPRYPACLGVITSTTGAAIRDVLSVLERRWPLMPIIIYPVPVQGDAAAPAICSMIEAANRRRECDTLLLVRGGGSIEDLWAFNEEAVARAIRASKIPTVTGIGHEIDITIADLAADKSGVTPSAAAELLSPHRDRALELLQLTVDRLARSLAEMVKGQRLDLERLAGKLESPAARIAGMRQRVDELSMRMVRAMRTLGERNYLRLQGMDSRLPSLHPRPQIIAARERVKILLQERLCQAWARLYERTAEGVNGAARHLEAIGPREVLRRGYAILRRLDGSVVTSTDALAPGDIVHAKLYKGGADLKVERTERE